MRFPSALALVLLAACGGGAAAPAKPPGAPPTPATVTKADPGGDAVDPHRAALTRLLEEPFGLRKDRDNQVLVPLPDSGHWKRVRFWAVEHLVGFRYGDDHHALAIAFVLDVPEEQPTSEQCIRHFEGWGRPQIRSYDVEFDPFKAHHARYRDRPLVALSVDGRVSLGFSRPEFSAAWAAFATYPKACLVTAVAVPWRKSPELARRVRDRFVAEGFVQQQLLTETRPYRHEK